MKIAGVALDNYKVPTFRTNLTKAGFEFSEHDGITKDSKVLKVKFNITDFEKLKQILTLTNAVSKGRN